MQNQKKPPFEPEELPPGSPAVIRQRCGEASWRPMCRHVCTFGTQHFDEIMLNLVKNPNLNSKWLFRADVLYDDDSQNLPSEAAGTMDERPLIQDFEEFSFRGIGQLHEWDVATNTGTTSVHFLFFNAESGVDEVDEVKLGRIAYHLLQTIHKHGHGKAEGYVKRVHHDIIVPREKFQDRYSELKNKHARTLVQSWLETTDPTKHVFEDLGIAAFLIELWAGMYQDGNFPGFVDIGCGNGLLVHILRLEGYAGWGFDARERKSWSQYNSTFPGSPSGKSLQKLLLLPSVIPRKTDDGETGAISPEDIHDGIFPKGTFIISNHADELTPWTPIIAAISQCPFIMIPCCSHNLTGDRWRAPPPRDRTKPSSMFASLVDWVTQIAEDCGWDLETEMLRIPSTRNTGLVGREKTKEIEEVDIDDIVQKYGGVHGYYDNVVKLLKSIPRGH
ncbi:hypothetical protein ACHAPA_005702 [Fusarium lateritium]